MPLTTVPITLPSYRECDTHQREETTSLSLLEEFIFEHTPEVAAQEQRFREQLLALLTETVVGAAHAARVQQAQFMMSVTLAAAPAALPTHQAVQDKKDGNEKLSALECFVYEYEPAGSSEERWRRKLLLLVDELLGVKRDGTGTKVNQG